MSVLEKIKEYKLQEVAEKSLERPLADIEAAARDAPRPRHFAETVAQNSIMGKYALIGEIKKASPSKGLIREDFDPATLAQAYAEGGACCLSVLTDGPSFQGHDAYLDQAKTACDLPVLRKDFIYDPWQVVESRALGADCILLILATLSDEQARELEAAATEWGMDVLIETHDEAEVDRAAKLSARLIGINNRNLHTFETDILTTRNLVRSVPPDRTIVSESGLNTRRDLAQLASYGVRSFLIGESLMREPDVASAAKDLLRGPWVPEAG